MQDSQAAANEPDLAYLRLLSRQFPSIQAASAEIINLEAILSLPKGTEHFVSDVHGESEAFLHVLKNGSGLIRRKIEDIFGDSLSEKDKNALAALIYYPEQRMSLLVPRLPDPEAWYAETLFRLIRMCRVLSSKYTRSKVRKALPPAFSYVIEELLHEQESNPDKQEYYRSIISSIIRTGRAPAFIEAMAELIQRLAVDHLHVLGDVFDRGPGAHLIMDRLLSYHSVDFQWGNHDLAWMGAAAGSEALVANAVRLSLRYANLSTLEDGYAISLLPLAAFAMETYADDPADGFLPRFSGERAWTEGEKLLLARMHKAISIIQHKLEAAIIARRPCFGMEGRDVLAGMDLASCTVRIGERTWELNDCLFPTIDQASPNALSLGERVVIDRLTRSFLDSDKLQAHARFLWNRGSLYLSRNGNLLYHGCIPLAADGSFAAFRGPDGKEHRGREFMDYLEAWARRGASSQDPEKRLYGQDVIWYLWTGPLSPVYGKSKMATFERAFIDDPESHVETQNPYYVWRDREEFVRRVLSEFGLDPERGHIVNGHVPVKVKKGESPIKAGGKLLVIDGGFSRAYQSVTGIAGYTLLSNSYGLLLASHHPFVSAARAIEEAEDLYTSTEILENNHLRIRIRDTDNGRELSRRIGELSALLAAYREGAITEGA